MGEVLEKESFLKKFKILSGEPLFKKGYQAEADAFHHEAYANTIYKLLLNNKPPLTIGLLGSWGIGKSTVINILLDKIKKEQSHNLMPVYFNAWKYSGDSFRRQFLLAVAEQILSNKEKEAEVDRIRNLFHKEILKEEKKPILESLKEHFTHFKKEPLRLLKLAINSIAIALLVFALIKFKIPDSIVAIATGFLLYLLTKTIPDTFQVNIPFETDPQLVLPEQFEQKFKDILDFKKLEHLKGKNILIIIDDFDRCHPQMIYDILTSVKTFLKHNRCFFLIALDDKSVVEILSKENPRYKNYEELRKYFDATVRMCPIGESDLVDFANTVAREKGIPENIIQIAILAEYNDARKMKHFINTFAAKYRIGKERETAGFIPFDIDAQLDALAKMVVIEIQYPHVFEQIVKEPQFLEKLEKQTFGSNPGNESDMKKYFENNPGLKGFLEDTRDVKIKYPELFFILKASNIEVKLPRGTALKNAIVRSQRDIINGILKEIDTDKKKNFLVDLTIDMLNRTTAIFLRNTTTFALDVINLEGFLRDNNKSKLSQAVCKNFFRPSERQLIFTQNINYFFKCANIAGNNWLKELAQNSIEEINKEENILDHVDDIINNLHNYQLLIGQATWINTINKKLDEWHDKALKEHKELEYLQIIDRLYLPADKEEIRKEQPLILSIDTLKKIAKSISTNIDESAIKLNELKRKILFSRWNDALKEIVSERTQAIFAQYPNEATFSQPIRFAIETIVDMPVWLDGKNATQVAASVQSFYTRCGERRGKMESLKAILKAASTIPEPTTRNNSIDFFLEESTQFSESEIKEFDEFITQYKDNEIWQDIKKKFVIRQWKIVKSQRNAPNEMIKQRFIYCHKNEEFLEVSEISDFLASSLDVESEHALSFWKNFVVDYVKKNAELSRQIITKCMKTIKATQTTDSRRRINCEIFLGLLSQISKNKRNTFVEEFIALLNNPDPPIRNCAVSLLSKIEELSLKRDFKIALNDVTRDLCNKSPQEILDYRSSLDTTLKYPDLWRNAQWESLAELIIRMLDLNLPENIRKYARELVRKVPKVPKACASDLTHRLIQLSGNSPIDEEKQDCVNILSEMKEKGLNQKAIDQFFREQS